ncbi:helix-turn-helix domain-containing protein [Nitrospina watsonii]|uniref:Helix-turn-helix motif protein (Modular protein) n=1 Tax=Nitrospina watsonii TaxID=1323948 RepID=A0ABM9HEU4_9BACT|nr:helix-turn-helix domain-containing protein [Nitrospina watsonii]CAI2718723.1 Putative helix-turn-helix motif protein (Modular protein) [Nitrospina watsonii]
MTVLSENMRTIRKSLKCTQMAFAQIMDIGFRTYVRYESGERDAPVAVLIKLARLADISLDRLLTTRVSVQELTRPDSERPPVKADSIEVVGGSLNEGRLMFKGIKEDFYITASPNEKKLLGHYRKLTPRSKEKCLKEVQDWALSRKRGGNGAATPKKVLKAKNTQKLKKMVKSIKKITVK